MSRKQKWILSISLIVLPITFIIIVVDWLTRYAYDRKSPKLPKFLVDIVMGNQKTNEGKKRATKILAEDLKKKAGTKVQIVSYDGEILTGHYYPCTNAERIMIACHGWRSGWNYDYRTIAPFLHEHNTAVLMIELRAHGESGGRYLYYGKKERFDIARWTHYAAEHLAPGIPVYVMGMSVGALCTLMSAAAGLHKATKGLIADSGCASARAFGMSVIDNLHVNPRILYPLIRLDARLRLGMDDNAYTATDALKNNQRPILFIHGTKDVVADIRSMEKLYENCKSPKFKLIVDGAGHMQSCFVDPCSYQNALLDFFRFCEST